MELMKVLGILSEDSVLSLTCPSVIEKEPCLLPLCSDILWQQGKLAQGQAGVAFTQAQRRV